VEEKIKDRNPKARIGRKTDRDDSDDELFRSISVRRIRGSSWGKTNMSAKLN